MVEETITESVPLLVVGENVGNDGENVGNDAPNIIIDGKCRSCVAVIDVNTHGIKCSVCNNIFHAINCTDDSYNVSSQSVFTNHLSPAINKTNLLQITQGS